MTKIAHRFSHLALSIADSLRGVAGQSVHDFKTSHVAFLRVELSLEQEPLSYVRLLWLPHPLWIHNSNFSLLRTAKHGGKSCLQNVTKGSAACTAPCGYEGSIGAVNQTIKYFGNDLDFRGGKQESSRRLRGR
jgi:hypothetical protein